MQKKTAAKKAAKTDRWGAEIPSKRETEMRKKIAENFDYCEKMIASDIIKFGFEGIKANLQLCILGHVNILREYGQIKDA